MQANAPSLGGFDGEGHEPFVRQKPPLHWNKASRGSKSWCHTFLNRGRTPKWNLCDPYRIYHSTPTDTRFIAIEFELLSLDHQRTEMKDDRDIPRGLPPTFHLSMQSIASMTFLLENLPPN